ncbi:MAG TPA: hypothetical protein VKZ49_15685 [Polyangiaceae bacterium]|nr:hypothetical protein [Polyangiaceae bacterium]
MFEELSARQFERSFQQLIAEAGAITANRGCIECKDCKGCTDCTFCRDSERLVRCHYCVSCVACSDCSHCRSSTHLLNCQHCVLAENCSNSAYLIRCIGLTGCSYCFGCVGLHGKDFHLLNQPLERSEYFAQVQRLSRELGL